MSWLPNTSGALSILVTLKGVGESAEINRLWIDPEKGTGAFSLVILSWAVSSEAVHADEPSIRGPDARWFAGTRIRCRRAGLYERIDAAPPTQPQSARGLRGFANRAGGEQNVVYETALGGSNTSWHGSELPNCNPVVNQANTRKRLPPFFTHGTGRSPFPTADCSIRSAKPIRTEYDSGRLVGQRRAHCGPTLRFPRLWLE